MAHIIEVVRAGEEARSFLDALFYSDSVSAIGYRADEENVRAVAVNWDEDAMSELDDRISETITDAPRARAKKWTRIAALSQTLSRNRCLSTGATGC